MKHTFWLYARPFAFTLAAMGCLATSTQRGDAQAKKPIFPQVGPPMDPTILKMRDPNYWAQRRKDQNAVTDVSWVNQRWTGDDGPYAATRTRLGQEFIASQDPQALYSQYKATAQKKPNDALMQYAWGLATLLADKSPRFHVENREDFLYTVNTALAEAPSPHTYNYDRLRYLLWFAFGGGGGSHYLTGMAERLLQKDPNDFPVLLDQSLIYAQNRSTMARKHGLALMQRLANKYPNRAEVYDALGCWYYSEYVFADYHSASDYQQSLAMYRKALDLYPANSVRRAQLPAVMQFVTSQFHRISKT